jgi:Protein of unknown function (DUF1552)
VLITLPWLESLAPRTASGAPAPLPRRFLPIFFPCGVADYWTPSATGAGAAWQLSPILEPLRPLKDQLIVLTDVENYTCIQADNPSVEPEARDTGAFLTCVDARKIRDAKRLMDANGISVDQVLAQALAPPTRFESLQLGLSTVQGYCDGQPCSLSRSISWKSETEPLYKQIDPQAVWDLLFTGPDAPPDPSTKDVDSSVLDAVLDSARGLDQKLGASDRQRLDEFLTKVRATEQKLNAPIMPGCRAPARPQLSASEGLKNGDMTASGVPYDRGEHSKLMSELILLAFQCDATRIISYMLDDARSEFSYDHVAKRSFDANGSTAGAGVCGNFNGASHSGGLSNDFASINWWLTSQVADLCQKLAATPEGDGSMIDNTFVLYASSMHGTSLNAANLPLLLVGGKAGLKTDQHIAYGDKPPALRDVYFTLLNACFGANQTSFGASVLNVPNRLMTELLP